MTKINMSTKKLPFGGKNSKNLDSIYSRILNQKLESNKLNNLESKTQKVQEKSLNSRVVGLTKLNSKLNSLELINLINNKSILSEIKDKLSNKTISITNKPKPKSKKKKNMIDDYVAYKKRERERERLATSSSIQNNKFKLKKYLQTIYGFDASLVDLILSKDLVYNFNSNIKKFKLDSILDNSFYTKKSLTGTKVFEITPDNVTLQLFLYSSTGKNLLRIKNDYLDYLCAYISKKIQKPFKLNLIRLKNLKSDSVISVKAIGIVANKIKNSIRPVAYRFLRNSRVIKPKMVRNALLSAKAGKRGLRKLSFFTGIHIKLGGRLKRQRLTNRITTMTFQKGSLNRVNSDLLTTSRYTSKSVRGAFSITVTMGHKFF